MFRVRNWKIYNDARKIRLEINKNLINKIFDKEKIFLSPKLRELLIQ